MAVVKDRDGPRLNLERLTPIFELVRAYNDHRAQVVTLNAFVDSLQAEVQELETWASSRGKKAQRAGPTIRQALDFLKTFGRLTTLDFSFVPLEERRLLVSLLALEHRWCYAAAGTTRDSFKSAVGRTGAR